VIKHFAAIIGIIVLILLAILYPFCPGRYDPLAVPISTAVQVYCAVGLLLVPIAALWLVSDLVLWSRKRSAPRLGFTFAMVSLFIGTTAAIASSLAVMFGISLPLGIAGVVLWGFVVIRCVPGLQRMRTEMSSRIHPAPVSMLAILLGVLLVQFAFAIPMTESSRNRAIARSREFVDQIETYRNRYGRYPVSLAAMWKDYDPGVVGIEKYHYAPFGDAYNLFFEQPKLLLDNIGTREWVVYNPMDDQRMYSHAAWFLLLTPEELERSQGWYAVHDAQVPHWKSFWFD
jgi:hypothetical protein